MAEITKPDMSSLWASDGAVIAPTSAKIKTGWTPEIPPHQWENFVQNRQDNAIAYLFQRGVPEWDSSTEYFNNKSLVMGSDGVLYRAVSNSVGVDPTTDSGANWISLTANASESVVGVIKIATTAQANAMTDDNVAITPAKLGGLLGTKSVIAGNGLTGGGTLDTTRTLTLGTPSTLSGNTTNSVTASSHTHALASASESVAGVVEIATTAEAQALVADDVAITPKKLSDALGSAKGISIFTSNGSFTVPAGVTKVWLSGCGGGGGGGGAGGASANNTGGGGAGGGAGKPVIRQPYTVVPGATLNITIGGAGSGGNGSSGGGTASNGTAGGNTVITGMVGGTVTLNGGGGGGGANSSSSGGNGGLSPSVGFPIGVQGEEGNMEGIPTGNGGDGGGGPFGSAGFGAASTYNVQAPGYDAYGYGCGGGGAGGVYGTGTGAKGGAGAPGIVILEY